MLTQIKMSSSSKKTAAPKNPPPPEAYAAFVRIYIEWMEKDENEQIVLINRSVKNAAKFQKANFPSSNNSQFMLKDKPSSCLLPGLSTMYGAEFDEYVNEAWASFTEKCQDVDKFADYLQKDFDKCVRDYGEMRDEFLESVFQEWDTKTLNMTDAQANIYLQTEFNARVKEFQEMKAAFEKKHPGYPSLTTLLRRPAQNMMNRLRNNQAASRTVPIDMELDGLDIEDKTVNGAKVEDDIAIRDFIDRVMETLSELDKQIFSMKLQGYKQTDIAEKLKISDATVSNHIHKILNQLPSFK